MSESSKRKGGGRPVEPADNISSIFTARRDLLLATRQAVRGSGLSIEECDLLISLYGARVLGWDDIEHEQGFVTFTQLEHFLVHNASLLSRRVRKLATKPSLLEIIDADPGSGLHFNAKRVRITNEGVKRIEPVWKRYQQMSAKLLARIPPNQLKAHYEVNVEISKRIRARRSGLSELVSDET